MGVMGLHILYRLHYSIPYVYHTSIPHIRIPPPPHRRTLLIKPRREKTAQSPEAHTHASAPRGGMVHRRGTTSPKPFGKIELTQFVYTVQI